MGSQSMAEPDLRPDPHPFRPPVFPDPGPSWCNESHTPDGRFQTLRSRITGREARPAPGEPLTSLTHLASGSSESPGRPLSNHTHLPVHSVSHKQICTLSPAQTCKGWWPEKPQLVGLPAEPRDPHLSASCKLVDLPSFLGQ